MIIKFSALFCINALFAAVDGNFDALFAWFVAFCFAMSIIKKEGWPKNDGA
jgi:hypothetical protein